MKQKKQIWLEDGLKILSESGHENLTIDNLCIRLNLTKGSFYHHFKNRQTYIEELLKYWENENTLKIIEISNSGTTSNEKMKTLNKVTTNIAKSPEIAIRTWAFHDPLVKEYQTKADLMRIKYVRDISDSITKNEKEAELLSKLLYALFVGSYYILPNIDHKELQEIYSLLEKKFGV